MDPQRKGHLFTRNIAQGPKNYFPYIFNTLHDNLREEDNLSTKDKTSEFILSPTCPLFRGSTVTV